jgi:DNA-binding Xre family transcriptional regulator
MADRAGRSLKASPDGIKQVKAAVRNLAQSNTFLADKWGMSRAVLQNFLAGKPVGYDKFRKICDELELPWREIAELSIAELTEVKSNNHTSDSQVCPSNIDSSFVGREEAIASNKSTAEGEVVGHALSEQPDCKEIYQRGVFIPNARCRCVWGRDDLIEEVLHRLTDPQELPSED